VRNAIRLSFLVFIVFAAATCTRPIETSRPAVVMEVLDASLEEYAVMWQAEIGRRFPNAVGIFVHGGDFVEGQWIVGTNLSPHRVSSTVAVVKHYQSLYPDRTIVLLACNTGHLKLGIPGVYYATASVWCVPDRSLTPAMFTSGHAMRKMDSGYDGDEGEPADAQSRWQSAPEVVGNIYEFVSE
jgi:hypothetical protein